MIGGSLFYCDKGRLWVRVHEKGGKLHAMPCHHNLETYLHAYIDGCGLGCDPKGPLSERLAEALANAPGHSSIKQMRMR